MYFETRLWAFTEGVRSRIAWAALIGVASAICGIGRLALLGWFLGAILSGRDLHALGALLGAILAMMLLRALLEQARTMIAHGTAARVQAGLRRLLFEKIASLGPAYAGAQRSGEITLVLTDGVEQLETYFGKFLPQFMVAIVTPPLLFLAIAAIDLPVASVLLAFALLALFAPALWHGLDQRHAKALREAYAAFGSEFLDAIQGLATLKAFGQSEARGRRLADHAYRLCDRTMKVLGTNVLARGITDSAIACGAAAALALGAHRVTAGELSLSGLLIILMMGTEVFRPMRDLRAALHQGMVGMSAAQAIYRIFDARPLIEDAPPASIPSELPASLTFEEVRFRYPGTERRVHDGLSFTVAAGERIGIVGASGAGKSSIIRLLQRFYDPEQGRVLLGGHDLRSLSFAQIRSRMALVSQEATPFIGTIEDNLRMARPDARREQIEAAARAANIHDFIAGLPQGYATPVGERGIKLSGGQRQRLAIARALLRDAPLLVLDEALSAVDAENERVIQHALDRLMAGRTTLILAHRLSSVVGCDRIIVIDEGRVAESGTHEQLMQCGGLYAALMAEQARASAGIVPATESPAGSLVTPAGVATAETVAAPTEGVIAAAGMTWRDLFRELLAQVRPRHVELGAAVALGIARVATFTGVGAFSALVIRAIHDHRPVGTLLACLAVVAILSGLLHWLESWVSHDMAFCLLAQMRIRMFRTLDALAPAYLSRRRTGDLMALATSDIELVEYFFAHTVGPALVALLVPAAVLLLIGMQSLWVMLALLPFVAIVGLSPFLRRDRIDRLGSDVREAAGALGSVIVESVQGVAEIAAFQREQDRADRIGKLTERYAEARLPFFAELTRQQTLQELLTGLGGLAVAVAGASLAARGALDAGAVPLLTVLAMAAFLPVSEIAQMGRQLSDTLGATRRIYAVEQEPVTIVDGPGAAAICAAPAIRLENVRFTYPGRTAPQIRDVTIDIPAGATVALVGASGAGKTTIAQLLLRFWDPEAGRILLDGHDLRDFRLDTLRETIALVSQDTYLFNDTLGGNIRIARPDADDEQLAAAVRGAALDRLVERLPLGLDTPVGERGAALSGGQRQRVAVARALIKEAPLLILDEATSHLDAHSEDQIRRTLDALRHRRTTLVIAHRLSTIRDADLILVMRDGTIVESGSHSALLAQGGAYARFVAHQSAAANAA